VRPQHYKDLRPAEYFMPIHQRARERGPDWVYEVVRVLVAPLVLVVYRTRCIDPGKIPRHGPAIVAPNHFSFLDHFFVAVFVRRRLQFMGKSQLFRPPLGWVYRHAGVFPIRRGQRDEEAFETAHAILRRGGIVVMYAEGGRSRSEEFGHPRPGLGRLALESGVPVVPTAIAGSSGVRHWMRGRFPRVTVQYGDPVRFDRVPAPSRDQAQSASEVLFDRTRTLYEALDRGGRRRAVRAAREARRGPDAARGPDVLP
jgi:1-acyl-sn-glycerol-3-phosphate acyltransferase